MTSHNDFGESLRKHWETLGITQEELAEKVGLSPGYPTNMMAGIRTPPPEKLDLMANIFGLSGDERLDFIVLGALAHVPNEGGIRDFMLQTFRRLCLAEREFHRIEARMKTLEARLEGRKPGQ